MNNSWCWSHKKTPYELVYGDKPHGNCTLISKLFTKNIYDEENIPNTIQILSHLLPKKIKYQIPKWIMIL